MKAGKKGKTNRQYQVLNGKKKISGELSINLSLYKPPHSLVSNSVLQFDRPLCNNRQGHPIFVGCRFQVKRFLRAPPLFAVFHRIGSQFACGPLALVRVRRPHLLYLSQSFPLLSLLFPFRFLFKLPFYCSFILDSSTTSSTLERQDNSSTILPPRTT